jgi:hypothetical protein
MDQVVTGDTVGSFVEPAILLERFGCPGELLRRMTANGVVLALPTPGGQLGYPAFQFDATGEPLPGLPCVLDALDPFREHAWRDAVWLTTPNPALGGSTPAAALRSGAVDEVVTAASSGASL